VNTFANPRRWLKLAAVLVVVGAVAAPVSVMAVGGAFTDDDASVFEADIEWLAAAGITRGCNPPTNDLYCPKDSVTRGQMAAFLHRLGIAKIVDAATAVEADHAATADDSGLLDGNDSTAFLGATDKAADSDLLDGNDSSHYETLISGAQGTDLSGGVVGAAYSAILNETLIAPEAGNILVTYHFSGFVIGGDAPTSFRAGISIDDDTCASVIPDTHVYSTVGPFPSSDFGTTSASYVDTVATGVHTITLCVQTHTTPFAPAAVVRHGASGLQVVFSVP
jgi:hypothetical protein